MIRVATYNIHDCIGMDEEFNPARIAAVLKEIDADIFALQEVTVDSKGELVDMFENVTGMKAIDGTLFDRGVGRYGNLILTKFPVLDNCIHDISASGREPRGVIEMTFKADDSPIHIFATHLGLKFFERRSQIQRLVRLLPYEKPTIVMGDFNIWGLSVALNPLHKLGYRTHKVNSFPTHPRPLIALDRIVVNTSVRLQSCWRHATELSKQASDHYPVVAELDLVSGVE